MYIPKKRVRKVLTNLAPSYLHVLRMFHGCIAFGYRVVLHEAICVLERDLGEAAKLAKDIVDLALGDTLTRQVSYGPVRRS